MAKPSAMVAWMLVCTTGAQALAVGRHHHRDSLDARAPTAHATPLTDSLEREWGRECKTLMGRKQDGYNIYALPSEKEFTDCTTGFKMHADCYVCSTSETEVRISLRLSQVNPVKSRCSSHCGKGTANGFDEVQLHDLKLFRRHRSSIISILVPVVDTVQHIKPLKPIGIFDAWKFCDRPYRNPGVDGLSYDDCTKFVVAVQPPAAKVACGDACLNSPKRELAFAGQKQEKGIWCYSAVASMLIQHNFLGKAIKQCEIVSVYAEHDCCGSTSNECERTGVANYPLILASALGLEATKFEFDSPSFCVSPLPALPKSLRMNHKLDRVAYDLKADPLWADLKAEINAGRVLKVGTNGHDMVGIGYDDAGGSQERKILVHDPLTEKTDWRPFACLPPSDQALDLSQSAKALDSDYIHTFRPSLTSISGHRLRSIDGDITQAKPTSRLAQPAQLVYRGFVQDNEHLAVRMAGQAKDMGIQITKEEVFAFLALNPGNLELAFEALLSEKL